VTSKLFVLAIWLACAVWHVERQAKAATPFTVLHDFQDGGGVDAGVVVDNSRLYLASVFGGLYSMNKDGTGFSQLHSFPGSRVQVSPTLVGSTLIGPTTEGGQFNDGTIYSINTDGSGYRVLHSFNGTDGAEPFGSLTLIGSTLYGVTNTGGSANAGTIYSINIDGTGFRTLHSFLAGSSDGRFPSGTLATDGAILYGTTPFGGPNDGGMIYKLYSDGSGYQVLRTAGSGLSEPSTVTLNNSTLYGTAGFGVGYVFSMNTDSTGLKILHNFAGSPNDGDHPHTNATLVVNGSIIYGTTESGGSSDEGTVFQLSTDGSGYQLLHSFSGNDGARVRAGVVLDGTTLYGTAEFGGTWNDGTVYALAVPEPSAITLAALACAILLLLQNRVNCSAAK